MPVYEYKAFGPDGKEAKGTIEADVERDARDKLKQKKLLVSEIKVYSGKVTLSSEVSITKITRKINSREVAMVVRQLATLLKAGMPLVQSLAAIGDQLEGRPLQKIIIEIKEKVNEGGTLADAFELYPKLFSNIFVNMVRAGETAGALEITLLRLADFAEKSVALKHKVKSALAYPFFMSIMGFFVLFFLLSFVVPTIAKLFMEMNQKLPLPTAILIKTSSLIKDYFWIPLMFIAAGFFAFRKAKKNEKFRLAIDKIKLRLPLFGNLIRKIAVARFARTLGTLLSSGIPLVNAMEIVEKVIGNEEISEVLKEAKENISAGESIANTLKRSKVFPPIVSHMIAVGEAGGNLEEMLLGVADSYDEEVATTVNAMTSLLEPLIIVLMGMVVGFIVLSILLPIFEMNQIIK